MGGTPLFAGWFMRETSYLKRWMRTGSTPISGNLQVFYNVLVFAPPGGFG